MVKRLTKGLSKEEKSWILYDWASQGFVMIVMSVIFSLYFTESATTAFLGGAGGVAGASEAALLEAGAQATAYWGLANTVVTIIVGVLAPILGTLSGYKGKKKLIFTFFAYMGIIGTIGLALVPEQLWWLLLLVFAIASIGFSGANKIYDAFLVDVSPKENMNKVSTLGFGFAYVGGALPFILSIPFVILVEMNLINMPLVTAYRISFWIAALWWIGFSIPMFRNVKQQIGVDVEPQYIRKSFVRVWTTFLDIKKQKPILIFLIAFFLYSDGLGSIIRLAVSYGATIGLSAITLMLVLLVTQFVAFPCAIIYGRMAERVGAKKVIYFGIFTYCVICAIALTMNPERDIRFLTVMFWSLAMLVGTAQGGIQALSRSYFGRIIPKDKSNEYFGFYNVFGRFASILGTTFYGVIVLWTGRPHYGIGIIVVLFIAAAIVFRYAPDDRKYVDGEVVS
jgi:UMF1 family MFS transporter